MKLNLVALAAMAILSTGSFAMAADDAGAGAPAAPGASGTTPAPTSGKKLGHHRRHCLRRHGCSKKSSCPPNSSTAK